MNFEETFKNWTLEQKVEWALGPNICNLSENMRSIIVDLKAENERLKGEQKQMEVQDQVVFDGLRKENAKLRCLAMHAMSEYFLTMYELFPWSDRLREYGDKYKEAYLKAKKALREGK